MAKQEISILFVCLGNICRSPLGEGIFNKLVEEANLSDYFVIDSCGTGSWHIGSLPDPNSRAVAKKHGIDHLEQQQARQINEQDIEKFDYIIAMDKSNHRDIKHLGEIKGELSLLRDFEVFKSKSKDVPDPYGLTGDAFQEVYDIVFRCCENLLDHISKKHSL